MNLNYDFKLNLEHFNEDWNFSPIVNHLFLQRTYTNFDSKLDTQFFEDF